MKSMAKLLDARAKAFLLRFFPAMAALYAAIILVPLPWLYARIASLETNFLNGAGIPADVIEKVFDPFFTTKPVGDGTGLGLTICHRIVDEHGGTIDVKSEPGRGTTFVITLPALG